MSVEQAISGGLLGAGATWLLAAAVGLAGRNLAARRAAHLLLGVG